MKWDTKDILKQQLELKETLEIHKIKEWEIIEKEVKLIEKKIQFIKSQLGEKIHLKKLK